jgi:hypothetical protein
MRLPPWVIVLALASAAAACGAETGEVETVFAGVGRLARGDRVGPCGVTFIRPDRVLTAAHCVVDLRTWRPHRPDAFRAVVAGRSFPVLEIAVPEERALSPSGRILDLRHDWAVLRVAANAGAAPRPLPLAGERAARLAFVLDEPVAKVGVVPPEDGGRNEVRSQAGCRISGIEPGGGLLSYRCGDGATTTGPGASGSPLLRGTGDGSYEVIGVLSAKAGGGPAGEVGFVAIPPAGT